VSDRQQRAWDVLKSVGMRCPVCGRTFESDPIYDYVGAVPRPSNIAKQVTAYHATRLRFEDQGCQAVGLEHVRPDA
jgi:hypothetical protein